MAQRPQTRPPSYWLAGVPVFLLVSVLTWKGLLALVPEPPQLRRTLVNGEPLAGPGRYLIVGGRDEFPTMQPPTGDSPALPLQTFRTEGDENSARGTKITDLLGSLGHAPPVIITLDDERRIVRIQPISP